MTGARVDRRDAHQRNGHSRPAAKVSPYPACLKHNLVRNPKTPIGMSLQFLNRLNSRDLKNLLADKNVPDALRKTAKKVFDQRNQKTKVFSRKK